MSSILRTPNYIRANTPEELRKAMLRNNIDNQTEHHYFDVGRDGRLWIVWYMTMNPTPSPEPVKKPTDVVIKPLKKTTGKVARKKKVNNG